MVHQFQEFILAEENLTSREADGKRGFPGGRDGGHLVDIAESLIEGHVPVLDTGVCVDQAVAAGGVAALGEYEDQRV